MPNESSATPLVIRIATSNDLTQIERLDSLSTSPTRDMHRT